MFHVQDWRQAAPPTFRKMYDFILVNLRVFTRKSTPLFQLICDIILVNRRFYSRNLRLIFSQLASNTRVVKKKEKTNREM